MIKICLRMSTNISIKPLIIKPGMSSISTDLDGLKRLIALKISESETRAKDKNSDDERAGKTSGQGLLYTDWKCFENSLASAYYQPQAGEK